MNSGAVLLCRRALRRSKLLRQSFTCSSHHKNSPTEDVPLSTHITRLPHRSLVSVKGPDGNNLLQGLVTNDMAEWGQNSSAYSMFLNAQGRVMYDIIIYRQGQQDYMIECDSGALDEVVKHLKRYALRSKVSIEKELSYKVWASYPGKMVDVPDNKDILSCSDPRWSSFGSRILAPGLVSESEIAPSLSLTSADGYHRHRLALGVAEGTDEVPLGACFPLEYNLDYLNGVSFSKGCYLGQELTARSFHTGVIRKRVMPVSLTEDVSDSTSVQGTKIVNSSGKNIGKLIKRFGGIGLALIRVQDINTAVPLSLQTDKGENKICDIRVHTPSWWP